jgi:hypothetical protein
MANQAQEYIAPISVDLRQPDNRMDITKGIEHINIKDEVLDASMVAQDVELGDWLLMGPNNTMIAPTSVGQYGTFPVWVGNDQYDAQATGNVTIIPSGGFFYRTNKFVPGSYTNGMNLTVKATSAGVRIPSPAGVNDAILARVYKAPDSNGVMEIEVLDR